MSSYRFDKRTKEQFAADIKECTRLEHVLMQVYVDWLNAGGSTSGRKYSFVPHGCGPDGSLITDSKKVTTAADFMLHADGVADRKIEIKFSRKESDQFHLKVPQVQSYIKNDVCVVTFVDIENASGQARFCILTPALLQAELDKNKIVTFWSKPCLKWNKNNIPSWHQIQLVLPSKNMSASKD